MHNREPRATIDYETRSAADIRNGAWLYAKHPSTRILCLSFKLPGDKRSSGWHAAYTDDDTGIHYPAEEYGESTLKDLFDWIESGGLVEAHNSFFERCISHHIASRPYGMDENGATGLGMPPIKETQWRCSAAKCAAFALPRNLGDAGKALRLPIQKDEEGRKIMLRLSKPRRPRKGEDPKGEYYINNHEMFRRLYSYCDTDVESEEAVSEAIPDLNDFEYKVWLADQRANWRGVRVDMELVYAAMRLDTAIKRRMNKRLFDITGVERGTMRTQLLQWLNDQGIKLADTAAPTLDWFMNHPDYQSLSKDVQEAVKIMRNINRTSIRKFHRIRDCVDPDDGRVRELVMYHGAATGRWSGKGIQVQNFPRGRLEGPNGTAPWDLTIDDAVALVKEADLPWLYALFGDDILDLISSVTRAAIIATEGYDIVVADYSAIEARVVLWLADAKTALEVFTRGDDIYCDMASGIYGRPITKKDKDERQFGKVTILGLGYGMGFLTFLLTLRGYDLHFTEAQAKEIVGDKWDKYHKWVSRRLFPDSQDYAQNAEGLRKFKAARRQASKDQRKLTDAREDPRSVMHELVLCKFVVDAYRARYPEVVDLWKIQEDAAIDAVRQWRNIKREYENEHWEEFTGDGPVIECGKVTWQVCGRFLFCTLPSGRRLVYTDPEINESPTPWGGTRSELRFWGVHKKTKKWARMGTYGGSIVENIDQGTARDMMAHALVNCDEHDDYIAMMTVHDELVAETPEGVGTYKEFEGLLTDLPEVYDGCPIAAEGGQFKCYRK
jgi:DNA polymerase